MLLFLHKNLMNPSQMSPNHKIRKLDSEIITYTNIKGDSLKIQGSGLHMTTITLKTTEGITMVKKSSRISHLR
jgi:hypothetical protein